MPRRGAATPATVVASVIVGGSILAGSWMVTSSLKDTTTQLGDIRASLAETKQALENVAKAQASAPKKRGPDPNKRYTIKAAGAPARGPSTAKVKIFEFSDFQ